MNFFGLSITEVGLVVYVFFIASSVWILLKKDEKVLSLLFPVLSTLEGLFIDWRWGKLNLFDETTQVLYGALPSFIIAIGFPYIGFFLHYFIPKSIKSYLFETNSFPFTDSPPVYAAQQYAYFKRGLIYSVVTLLFHEISQVLHISSRNTFDTNDLWAIVLGSVLSVVVFYTIQKVSRTNKLNQ